jgi:flagellar hook-associated protein 3 FlgL
MRISTLGINAQAVNAILNQQAALAKSQQQIATGKRIQTAADDPAAAVQLQELARLQSQYDQFGKNSVAATGRLQLEEQALSDSTNVLQRVRDLTLQANTATLTDSDRQSLVTEIRARISELQGIANRKDNNGDYLFAGFAAGTTPYARNASGSMVYAGDSGVRQVQIDAGLGVPDGDPGSQVFANIKAGNGLFTTGANAANTGSASIDTGVIVQKANWVPGQYTLSFTNATTWQVTDSSNAVVATGPFVSGNAISFRGVQVTISGVPATGDRFSINAASTTDVFSSLDSLVNSLSQGANGDAASAKLNTALGGAIQQLDQSLDHFSSVRAQVGARLSTIDDMTSTRDSRTTDIATSTSQLSDLDYASAVSKMNQQYVGLQAAQQSYAQISKLSLFNFL